MNIRDDIRQLKTGPRELRRFALTVGGVFVILGLFSLFRHKALWPYFFWPGAVLVSLGVILPKALKWIYVIWMSVAFVLGFVMAHIILTLFFYLVITPVGLLARVVGKDFLNLKLDRSGGSYWIPRERKAKPPADYERQF